MEYSDEDNLAAIWANINITKLCINTVHNNYNNLIIAGENHSNTILDNFMTVEGDHINAIQGDLDNLTNVEDYLVENYDDSIDVECLADIYDDPMGVEHLATIYYNPMDVEEECLATIYDNPTNVEEECLSIIYDNPTNVEEECLTTDTTDIEKNITQNDNINFIEELNINVGNSFSL
ncbi:13185_t:CDS:2 [Gigaspora rosea]|nr:13185_t:CDS:2 [Gigaspora rosea]